MAISLLPFNFLSPPSNTSPPQYLSFLDSHSSTHSSRISRARKFKISCCHQTVQIGDEADSLKKKRKPRPSFLEQVQNKWSLKMPSLRGNFPWQEQEIGETNQESQDSSSDVASGKEVEKSSPASQPFSSSHLINKSSSAPWDHGRGNRNALIPKRSTNSAKNDVRGTEQIDELCRNEESLVSDVERSDNLAKDVIIDGKREQEWREFDQAPIELPDNYDNLDSIKYSPTGRRNLYGIKHSSGKVALDKLPWERTNDEEIEKNDKLRNKKTVLAESLIPEHELKRLRNVSLRMVERIKVGAAGVTQALVETIHEKWKDEEVVKLKFEGPPSKNMKRTHEFLESRTGGVVIWRSGSSVVLYRGLTYKFDCVKSYSNQADSGALVSSGRLNGASQSSVPFNSTYFKSLSEEEQMDLSELNLVLEELGPRFMDWSGRDPVPVDADLLPAVVPGYKTPFRLLPHGTRRVLRDKEMTYLRRAAREMAPHFALGRNRQLQGLAAAMVKLWEKSAIAKIVIKRGVLNTSNERMAEELKILTGGTLLSRNKEFIVFYRGNDFLPPLVSSALVEAEKHTTLQQDEEEQARNRAAALIDPKLKASKQQLVAGTLAETVAATSRWGNQLNSQEMEKMMRNAAIARLASLVNSLERKLALAKGKIRNAEKTLQKVLKNKEPEKVPTDLETLTDEERFLFRRIGSSMKPYLNLGRREVFDGTIENMHLHWKYRELVKIMGEQKTFSQVRHIALSLEAESGGVLVSVDRTPKGYCILVYRGKNYQPPLAFRPKTLLTRRQALARSIELQRREALKHHILDLEEKIEKTKQELDDLRSGNSKGAETLGSMTNAAFDDNDGKDVGMVEEGLASLSQQTGKQDVS